MFITTKQREQTHSQLKFKRWKMCLYRLSEVIIMPKMSLNQCLTKLPTKFLQPLKMHPLSPWKHLAEKTQATSITKIINKIWGCHHCYIWACAKRCSARTIHFLVLNASSGLSFLWTNLTLSERVCIKEIIKINLTPKVSFELVKYENLHQVWAENQQRKGGHFGCTASVVVLFASFFFRQFSLCCLTGHSQSFLMLVKTAHNYL